MKLMFRSLPSVPFCRLLDVHAVDDVAVLRRARAVDAEAAEAAFVARAGQARQRAENARARFRNQMRCLRRDDLHAAFCFTSMTGASALTSTESVRLAGAMREIDGQHRRSRP